MLSFNKSKLTPRFDDTEMEIIFHYPGQLMKSFDNPSFTSSFLDYQWKNLLEFRITTATLLRKRSDANIPCIDKLGEYDTYIILEISKLIGCVPPYWKRKMPLEYTLDICEGPIQLRKARQYIENYKELLPTFDAPCLELFNAISYFWLPVQNNKKGIVRFSYIDKFYEEIQYSKDFGPESFLSNVGGFIGIFLGYSMMQFPELLVEILASFRKFKAGLFEGILLFNCSSFSTTYKYYINE